jgi:alpha-tubulin suppressor-like RCC1 family protein
VATRRYNIAGPVSGLSTGVAQVAATDSSTCALVNGGVKCWGSNRNGELGDGTTTDHPLPANVSGLTAGVADIAAGAMYACALGTGGSVRCWGSDATLNTTPRAIAGLASGVARIATGAQHGCAILATGAVKCWGRNERGQLGNGQTTTTNTPVDVSGLPGAATAIAAGTLHSCALLANGRLKCWGANDTGQLGNGTTTSSKTPVDVIGIGRVVGVTAFVDTTCALTASGAVWCWGQVSGGRRGVPWQVPTLANAVTGIAASNTHGCFMVAGGGVRCFGNNAAGQLGDGTHVIERRTPETVVAADGASFLDLTPEDPLIRSLLSPFVATTTASGSNVTAQVQVPPAAAPRISTSSRSLPPRACWGPRRPRAKWPRRTTRSRACSRSSTRRGSSQR